MNPLSDFYTTIVVTFVLLLVVSLTGGCSGFHFDGKLDIEPVIEDPSHEGQPKEQDNEDETNPGEIA